MKTGAAWKGEAPEQNTASPRRLLSHRGAALPLVLALLFLVLLLALLTLRTGGDHAVRGHLTADSLEADALTRLPLNIVLSQLQAGTVDLPPGAGWVSQPGMIRTFRTNPENGASAPETLMHHRLYSAAVMSSPGFDPAGEAAALSAWNTAPSVWTDLNEPVPVRQKGGADLAYPIADPAWLGKVEGYDLRSAAPAATPRQPLPLPAAWIYVLRDGRLVMPVSHDGDGASFDRSQVTDQNPITARVAFWTDDESGKLNLNTATEPDPWDSPAANTLTERRFAENPPRPEEVWRMSAHPAYTGLSTVLRHFGNGKPGDIQWPPDPDDRGDSGVGDSQRRDPSLAFYQSVVPGGHGPLDSLEDFGRSADRLPDSTGGGGGFRMAEEDARRSRFLLTTHAVAPELNPWGQPKVALWMMPRNPEKRSLEDRRMNAVSQLPGGAEFMFQRAANWAGPENPGSSQSMTADWTEVPRNRELYAWLQSLTDRPAPGFGGSFSEKYGPRGRDQILTSMLDMLRWSVNTGPYLPPAAGAANPLGTGRNSGVPLILDQADGTAWTRGFGRFPTVTEVAIVFAFTDVERDAAGQPVDADGDGICDRATRLRAFMVVNPFLAAAGSPAVSPAFSLRLRRLQHFTVGQGIGLLLPGGNARNRCVFAGGGAGLDPDNSTGAIGFSGFASQFLQADGAPKVWGLQDDPARGFPFASSGDVRLPADSGRPGGSIRFSGGAIIVDFMAPDAASASPRPGDAIHSVELEFPDRPIPFPALPVADFRDGPLTLAGRLTPVVAADGPRLPLIRKGDVVRSMILNASGPTHGDVRLLAARREALFANDEANRALFVPHPDYESPAVMRAHSLPAEFLEAPPLPEPATAASGQAGSLLAHVAYAANALPSVPTGLQGAVIPPRGGDPDGGAGDWESGPGRLRDGPFVNRAPRLAMAPPAGSQPPPQDLPSTAPEIPFTAFRFGGIPSGLYGDSTDPSPRPWQTLLFCPNPAGRTSASGPSGQHGGGADDHAGFATPPDHLWLEYFWHPVTRPRPLSARLATEGKVNLNFQILPWTWLRRATAVHGALRGVRVTAIPTAAMTGENPSAKGNADGSPVPWEFRYAVDATRTLEAFEQRFDTGRIFRYPSEICDLFLVPRRIAGAGYDLGGKSLADPADQDSQNLTAWWNGKPEDSGDAFEATGDNLRESPYAQLYPRVCTQSNTFRVHYRVQVLKKLSGAPPFIWRENRDAVVSERRGSYRIERCFDPSGPVPDSATHPEAPSLHTRHRLVTGGHERFMP